MNTISQLQAPKNDREILSFPSLDDVPEIVVRNRQRRASWHGDALGLDIQDMCRQARKEALDTARLYLTELGEPIPDLYTDSILLAGHQPDLFHPGVWIKNFALHRLSQQTGATPLNLIVDNDAVKSTGLTVPTVTTPLPDIDDYSPSLHTIAYDKGGSEIPFEERSVEDEDLFSNFSKRVQTEWGFTPLLSEYWKEVRQSSKRTNLLGERLVAARRVYERRWGCHNLELPVSRLCDTESYGRFFLHILSELPRFHELHNRSVADFRRQRHVRSKNHPVPDLAVDGDWLEAPFWYWDIAQPIRRRLFARFTNSAIELSDGHDKCLLLPLDLKADVDKALADWRYLPNAGIKIRSRALTNTLYARIFLGDLFVHGIGGGKYDELTDELIRGFYGIEPPEYMVLSGTLLLPFPHYAADHETTHSLSRKLRELQLNPQRNLHGTPNEEMRQLICEKQSWIKKRWNNRSERLERCEALRKITNRLRFFLAEQEKETLEQLSKCRKEVHANEILMRRDYAFCLYPKELLREFCGQFL